jgi:hypothetical protein
MAEHTKRRTPQTRRHTAAPRPEGDPSPTYIQLAGDALLAGMTLEQAVAGLISRIKRDQGYLAYRKACNRRTSYDDQVQQDMRVLALAACWLTEHGAGVEDIAGVARPGGLGRQPHQQTSSGKAQEEVASF